MAHYFGTDGGAFYNFYSGIFGVLVITGGLLTNAWVNARRHNCHQPGCWRVGNHPAAGGQFMLCYRHHPDFQGRRPTADAIARLHREHLARQAAMVDKLHEVHQRVTSLGSENK